uniref:Uncharacterized protein n=1 Tax=Oreochromis niloticus TaxID=8128 RepID=A0A669EYR1_ORENI
MRDALPKCKPEGICVRSCVCLHNVRYRMCFFRSLCVCWCAVLCVCACVCPSSLVMVQRDKRKGWMKGFKHMIERKKWGWWRQHNL